VILAHTIAAAVSAMAAERTPAWCAKHGKTLEYAQAQVLALFEAGVMILVEFGGVVPSETPIDMDDVVREAKAMAEASKAKDEQVFTDLMLGAGSEPAPKRKPGRPRKGA